MDENLYKEINYEVDFLVKTGFYNIQEIIETIDDEFIDLDLDLDKVTVIVEDFFNKYNNGNSNSADFNNLKKAFGELSGNNILAVHNCGYDPEEGINDSIELYTHLINNNYKPSGFAFYTLYDVENVMDNNKLNIYFGDFHGNKDNGMRLSEIIIRVLENNNFNVAWNKNIENPIVINDFNWKKVYDNENYFMEGAYDEFTAVNKPLH